MSGVNAGGLDPSLFFGNNGTVISPDLVIGPAGNTLTVFPIGTVLDGSATSGILIPQAQTQGGPTFGSREVIHQAYGTTGNIGATNFLISRNTTSSPGGAVFSSDAYPLRWLADDGAAFTQFAALICEVNGSVTASTVVGGNITVPGIVPGTCYMETANSSGTLTQAWVADTGQNLSVIGEVYSRYSGWGTPAAGYGAFSGGAVTGGRFGGNGSGCDFEAVDSVGSAAACVLHSAGSTPTFQINNLLQYGTLTASACTNSGYITINDSGGTSRKLMVCT
jgi:hypothetical protein